MLLNEKRRKLARPAWSGFVRVSVAMGAAVLLAAPLMTRFALAGPDDEDQRARERERQRDRDREAGERERIERREREERVRGERAEEHRRRDEESAQREREERIHHLERALAEARERREKGRGSDDEIAGLGRELDRVRSSGRRERTERREVHSFRRPVASEEQRDLIREQMALLDEALEQEAIRRDAGASEPERFIDLRMRRLQLERELIHHLPERGAEELERERGIVREQIEMAAEAAARVEQQSNFLGKPGEALEFKMRLLGLKRELAALNAPQREVRVFRREVIEGHPREGGLEREHAEQRERMEQEHREHRERHERAVAEAEERARRAHEQAERRMQEAMAGRRRQAARGRELPNPDAQRDRAMANEKRALEAEKVAEMQRKRAQEQVRLAEEQQAELKAALEAERNRRAALEKELNALRERLKALEKKTDSN